MSRKRARAHHPVEIVQRLLDIADKNTDILTATRGGLSRTYMSNIRHGHRPNPGIVGLVKLADALDYEIVLRPKLLGIKFK